MKITFVLAAIALLSLSGCDLLTDAEPCTQKLTKFTSINLPTGDQYELDQLSIMFIGNYGNTGKNLITATISLQRTDVCFNKPIKASARCRIRSEESDNEEIAIKWNVKANSCFWTDDEEINLGYRYVDSQEILDEPVNFFGLLFYKGEKEFQIKPCFDTTQGAVYADLTVEIMTDDGISGEEEAKEYVQRLISLIEVQFIYTT